MNYFEAKKLLDEVKEGKLHSLNKITLALKLTGDLNFEIRKRKIWRARIQIPVPCEARHLDANTQPRWGIQMASRLHRQ